MPAEITMPQLTDTMTEGTVVKWNKKEGDKVNSGEELADIETDKATMPMEAFDAGVLAHVAAKEGQKVKVGGLIAVIATAGEKPEDVKAKYAGQGAPQAPQPAPTARPAPVRTPPPTAVPSSKPAAPDARPGLKPPPSKNVPHYDFDLVVIGGGPAGYAAGIRAGQLKKRVLCIEKENLGGTCLNWGCIPTKSLLEDGAMVRRLKNEGAQHGITFDNLRIDFPKMVARSRTIAGKLQNGVASLFRKYEVKHEMAVAQLAGPHKVRYSGKGGSKEVSAEHVIVATGAKPMQLPGLEFDGKKIIAYREAMTLSQQPKRMAIIGAGAIGCEFADFYNAIGTEVTIVEMLPSLLPNEDEDVSLLLRRSFERRGIKVFTGTKTEKAEKTSGGVKLTLSGANAAPLEVDVVLVAVGVTANTEGLLPPDSKLELFKGRVKVDPTYKTNLENVWAVGDVISMHWPEQDAMAGYRHPDLAHVAHHEAVNCVERIFGVSDHRIDYRNIPGCTYTHPQVASMGINEKRLKEQKREYRMGKFPFSASGRALAAGETEGFVKLLFDAKYGELLGVHMIGENVTELLAELVLARKLEATEDEIIEAMHPHPTLSEAVMEAAGVAEGRAIHL